MSSADDIDVCYGDGDENCDADDERDEPAKSPPSASGEHTCYLCDKQFGSFSGLMRHLIQCENREDAPRLVLEHRHRHKRARKVRPVKVRVRHDVDHFTRMAGEKHAMPQDRAVTRSDKRLFARPRLNKLTNVVVSNRILHEVEMERRKKANEENHKEAAETERLFSHKNSDDQSHPGLSETVVGDDEYMDMGGVGSECDGIDFDDLDGEDDTHSPPMEEVDPRKLYPEDRWLPFTLRTGEGDYAEPYDGDGDLPPYYVMQLCLLNILDQHGAADLGMYDRIMKMMRHFSSTYPDIWTTCNIYKHHTRSNMIKFLGIHFKSATCIPKSDTVTIDKGKKVVTIPTFNFKDQLTSLLTDSSLLVDENFIQDPNFDKETLRPTKNPADYGPNDMIDEPHTGTLYWDGMTKYCSETDLPDSVDMVVPCPIILYADEVSTNHHGDLSIEYVDFVLGFLNHSARSQLKASRHLGAIPILGAGHGKYANNYDDDYARNLSNKKKINTAKASLQKVRDYQIIYRHILKSVKECCDEGGIRVMFRGKRCIFKPFIMSVLGDAKALNIWTCHYNCNGSTGVNCLVKDCHCTRLDTDNPQCKPIIRTERERAVHDPKLAKEISYHPVKCALDELPLSDDIEGASGITPYDILHGLLLGVVIDCAKFIHDLIGKNTAGAALKEALDLLFNAIHHYSHRSNSNKDIPTASTRFGLLDLSRRTALENLGNCLLLVICLLSDRGHEIMREVEKKHGITIRLNNIISTMTLLISYVRWCSEPKSKWELDQAGPAVKHLMRCIITHLPIPKRAKVKGSKEPGCNGYDKIKFHLIWKIYLQQFKFGSSRAFDTSWGEEHHKTTANKAGKQTQRRPSTFIQQTTLRDSQRVVVDTGMRCVNPDTSSWDNGRNWYKHNSIDSRRYMSGDVSKCSDPRLKGQCRVSASFMTNSDGEKWFEYELVWKQRAKTVIGEQLNDYFINALSQYCQHDQIQYEHDFVIDSFTELGVPSQAGTTTFRVSESFHGIKRSDWALMNEHDTNDNGYEENYYLGQLVGIFKFRSPGFPTPELIKQFDGGDALEINRVIHSRQSVDDQIYVAVRPSKDFFTREELVSDIGIKFELGKVGHEVYLVPATCVKDSAIVVPNFGASDSSSFIHISPTKHWHTVFRNKIVELNQVE